MQPLLLTLVICVGPNDMMLELKVYVNSETETRVSELPQVTRTALLFPELRR